MARTATYLALSTLAERYAAHGRRRVKRATLAPFELRVFSQNGEDGVIEEIIARVGAPARWFVEFGVESGVEANCVFLGEVLGWSGLFIEADPDHHARLEARWRHRPRVRTLLAAVAPENVESLFRAGGIPAEPDVLSIDVDGNDYWIWQAIQGFRPRVVVIEYNSALDAELRLVQPYDPSSTWGRTDFFGASLGALRALADQKGYRLVHTDLAGVNAFFVREDLARPFVAAADVEVRGPNYFLAGAGHPSDATGRAYVDPIA
jgi:hypothetical protein